ncbi:actin depolymerizing protein [Pluteus cervinus]|uniref:Actin depolymerizing protein n=1 Tax=Pluteus cervinus TaxID=181527 RepID=A0ACD3BEV6_9AGAR|nr:actin depolymerizing protein [Pluteus cervinus]
MSAASGIGISSDLSAKFAAAVDSSSTRFLKIIIDNETLVHDRSIAAQSSSLQADLVLLQDPAVLQDNDPAYILARLDNLTTDWLVIYYMPDTAKVRDKMLYASSRSSLLKSLGSTLFTESIFATSKLDLTPEAYAAHKRHQAAPLPLSSREKELFDLRAAESRGTYEGSRARASHVGAGVGLQWSDEVVNAVRELIIGSGSSIVITAIDPQTETLTLQDTTELEVGELGSKLPHSQPCFALFAWPVPRGSAKRQIVFIYSCPSSSPIKHRMLYSSGSASVFNAIKTLFGEVLVPQSELSSRKIETSDPTELNEAYLRSELGLDNAGEKPQTVVTEEKKPFARPRGPAKRRP